MNDYPVQPTFQRYFGKVERAMNEQSKTKKSKKRKQRFDKLTALIHSSDHSDIESYHCKLTWIITLM